MVTSFEFRAAPLGPDVFSGIVAQRFEDAKAYMQFHTEYVRTLPDEMTVWMIIRHAPPLPFLDEEVHGKLMVLVPHVYTGDPAEGERLIQPICDFGRPHGEFIGVNPWTGWQAAFDGLNEHGARNYWKSLNIHARWHDPAADEAHIAWARGLHEAAARFAEGVYVNFLSDEGPRRVRDAYPPATWDRLTALKRRYHPDNLFHMNQNIRP